MNLHLGLTGGPGCGKSAASDLFAARGFAIIDTDALAREVVEPGLPAWSRIREQFGPGFFDPAGNLIREKLAAFVFDNPEALARLNAIVHPKVRALWTSRADQFRHAGRSVIVVIPLLFELHLEKAFDRTLCVGCSAAAQRERLRCRGWDEAMIRGRLGAQWPLGEKCRLADHVLWNDGSLDVLGRQVRALATALAGEKMR